MVVLMLVVVVVIKDLGREIGGGKVVDGRMVCVRTVRIIEFALFRDGRLQRINILLIITHLTANSASRNDLLARQLWIQ